MKKLVLNLLVLLFSQPFLAQNKNFIDQPYIEVTGKALMEVAPDLIYVKIIISEKDNKAKASVEDLEKKMFSSLQQMGIHLEEDLSIVDLASNFEFYWLKQSDIYTSKQYELVLHNGNMVGKLYMELERLDISNISITKLDHSKIELFRRQVKVQAIQEAKEKAQEMMSAIDQKIGKAIFVQEINQDNYARPMYAMDANSQLKVRGSLAKAEELTIEFQKLELEYSVWVKFAIE